MSHQRKVALSSNATLIFNHGGRRMNKKIRPRRTTTAVVQERETSENLSSGDNQGQRGLIEVSRLSAAAQRRAEGGWTAVGARVRTEALIFSIKAAETPRAITQRLSMGSPLTHQAKASNQRVRQTNQLHRKTQRVVN